MPIKYRPMPLVSAKDVDRFWLNVDKRDSDECWPWTAGVNIHRGGYGRFWLKRIPYRTNRMAYWLHYGIDPAEQDACHSCDNPPCCNPVHLFRGTRADNLDDMTRKGRRIRGEQHGIAKLTEDQVREIRRSYVPRKIGSNQLAKRFGVCPMTILNVVKGKIWTHVT